MNDNTYLGRTAKQSTTKPQIPKDFRTDRQFRYRQATKCPAFLGWFRPIVSHKMYKEGRGPPYMYGAGAGLTALQPLPRDLAMFMRLSPDACVCAHVLVCVVIVVSFENLGMRFYGGLRCQWYTTLAVRVLAGRSGVHSARAALVWGLR